jgi:hypothetical protein
MLFPHISIMKGHLHEPTTHIHDEFTHQTSFTDLRKAWMSLWTTFIFSYFFFHFFFLQVFFRACIHPTPSWYDYFSITPCLYTVFHPSNRTHTLKLVFIRRRRGNKMFIDAISSNVHRWAFLWMFMNFSKCLGVIYHSERPSCTPWLINDYFFVTHRLSYINAQPYVTTSWLSCYISYIHHMSCMVDEATCV